jgi:hypothetical protein
MNQKDIKTPLLWSIAALQKDADYSPLTVSSVFLITDGCVQEEREIVKEVSKIAGDVRIITLGIGSYSNWFFLKVLLFFEKLELIFV